MSSNSEGLLLWEKISWLNVTWEGCIAAYFTGCLSEFYKRAKSVAKRVALHNRGGFLLKF